MIAERLGLDIVFDELLVTLPGIDIRPAMAGRRAAEKSKPHHRLLRCSQCSASRRVGKIVC